MGGNGEKRSGNSLERMKRARLLALLGAGALLAGLVAYGVLRPDPEERKIAELKGLILSAKPGAVSADRRRELRGMVEKLSPETRSKLIREVMRARLDDFRQKNSGLSKEEKRAKVEEVVAKMRERFSKLTPEARAGIKDGLGTEAGKKRMKEAMGFYYTEFTAEERELLDPLVNELSIELNSL
jgi:hypothetical protein